MAADRQHSGEEELPAPLFDRFEGQRSATLNDLCRDLADIIGARREGFGAAPGVLAWGLTGIGTYSPVSDRDQQRLAGQIASAITRFEPRLERVKVTPGEASGNFRFTVEASLVGEAERAIRVRIIAPRRGGALGADVVHIGGSD